MRNGSTQLGCFGFLALALCAYFLWIAVLYAGVPIALIGGAVAFCLLKNTDDELPSGHGSTRPAGYWIAAGSITLAAISLAGNIYTDDGPFGAKTGAARTAPSTETRPADRESSIPEQTTESIRRRIVRAKKWCDGMYLSTTSADDYPREMAACMKRKGVSEEDFATLDAERDWGQTTMHTRGMTEALRYCSQFKGNQNLYGDCLANERRLKGW